MHKFSELTIEFVNYLDLTIFVVEVNNQDTYHNIELDFHFTLMFLMGLYLH